MKLARKVGLLVTLASLGCCAPVFSQDSPPADNAPYMEDAPEVTAEDVTFGLADGPSFFAIAVPGEDLAMGFPGMPPMGDAAGMGSYGHGFAGLSLTDDQYEKLYAIKREGMVRRASSCGQMMSAHMALHDLLCQPALDKAKIMAAQNTINTMKTASANARMEQMVAMMNVLTTEQRAELHKRMVHRMVDGMGGMGKRGGWEHHGHGGHMGSHDGPQRHEHHGGPGGPGAHGGPGGAGGPGT